MSPGCSLKKKLRFPVIEKASVRKEGGGFVFHLCRPASALHPCNRTPPRWAGTCRRKGDTLQVAKRTAAYVCTEMRKKKTIPGKLTHYWCQFLQCAPGLHLLPPGLVGFVGAVKHLGFQDIFNHKADSVLLLWQKRPLPLCETPSLYRAAWCRDPPAVHTCHGGCPEHRKERVEPKNKFRISLK